jgi:hypothetical protein
MCCTFLLDGATRISISGGKGHVSIVMSCNGLVVCVLSIENRPAYNFTFHKASDNDVDFIISSTDKLLLRQIRVNWRTIYLDLHTIIAEFDEMVPNVQTNNLNISFTLIGGRRMLIDPIRGLIELHETQMSKYRTELLATLKDIQESCGMIGASSVRVNKQELRIYINDKEELVLPKTMKDLIFAFSKDNTLYILQNADTDMRRFVKTVDDLKKFIENPESLLSSAIANFYTLYQSFFPNLTAGELYMKHCSELNNILCYCGVNSTMNMRLNTSTKASDITGYIGVISSADNLTIRSNMDTLMFTQLKNHRVIVSGPLTYITDNEGRIYTSGNSTSELIEKLCTMGTNSNPADCLRIEPVVGVNGSLDPIYTVINYSVVGSVVVKFHFANDNLHIDKSPGDSSCIAVGSISMFFHFGNYICMVNGSDILIYDFISCNKYKIEDAYISDVGLVCRFRRYGNPHACAYMTFNSYRGTGLAKQTEPVDLISHIRCKNLFNDGIRSIGSCGASIVYSTPYHVSSDGVKCGDEIVSYIHSQPI